MSPHQLIPPPATAVPLPPLHETPDWRSIHETIKCPLCGYELRGLSEPLCPECGYRFDWPDLLDPTRRLHPWLFEHHPRRNIRSFFQTLFRNFRPGRFWMELHPSQPSRPRRLVLYWIVCALPLAMPVVLILVDRFGQIGRWRAGNLPFLSDLLHELWRDDTVRGTLMLCLAAAAFPWMNVLALLIFQQSMGRSKVRAQHVVRCAVYSGDVILWAGLLGSGAIVYWLLGGAGWRLDDSVLLIIAGITAAALWLNFARLVSACRNYLRFDRAFATVLATQAVVLLAAFTLLLYAAAYL